MKILVIGLISLLCLSLTGCAGSFSMFPNVGKDSFSRDEISKAFQQRDDLLMQAFQRLDKLDKKQ